MNKLRMIPMVEAQQNRPQKLNFSRLLARLGNGMQRQRRTILFIQWSVVFFYFFLLITPVFLPVPNEDAHIYNNLRLFAQFLFWGIWWPFVMLSMMLIGRVWCGIFCPEGTLTEFASRHGLGRSIPRWMRWGGWPFTAFVCTTLYGQLISVYEYSEAALLILGGSSVAAVAVGFIYGRGKRVWCRYLCPANGVFSLLAKIAPIHFRVDHTAWKYYSAEHLPMVDCAPLIDIRHMKSASACHACGRCSGYRDAVQLAARTPTSEILNTQNKEVKTQEALTLIFGVLGIATAAFLWSSSHALVQFKLMIASWLIDHDAFLLLQNNAPWWLLTHSPATQDMFTWLDGLCILFFILMGGMLLGLLLFIPLWLAARLTNHLQLSWQRLALGLVPLAGMSIFLGLSLLTLGHLNAERISLAWVPTVRIIILLLGSGFSLRLGYKLIAPQHSIRNLFAGLIYTLPVTLIILLWVKVFFGGGI